ncbi:MAG TPA: Mur ligase family protein, partial [Vicinamibacterales bacterium]
MARIHLIGVCGTAMATLAALLKHRGHEVSGSDEHVYPPMSDFLAAEGITVLEGYRPEHLHGALDLVVVGNAISRGNAELEAVLDSGVRYASLPETIREQFLWDAQSIVIAGTHGKTTTTALTGWLLTAAGADPTVLIGGIAKNFGADGASYRVGRGAPFVIEGDEYDSAYFDKTAKFLKYLPDIAVINNIEFDHADIYADIDEVRLAFRRLVNLVPRNGLTLIGVDSPDAGALVSQARSRVQTFGLRAEAEWRALEIRVGPGTTFRVERAGTDLGEFTMPLLGDHNVRNALAAIAVGVDVGLDVDRLRDGLASV